MSDTVTSTKTTVKTHVPGLWKVIFHNDNFTPMNFVVDVLVQIFNKSEAEAEFIMLKVHNENRAVVGIYPKEIGSSKVNETMTAAKHFGHPLLATLEEA